MIRIVEDMRDVNIYLSLRKQVGWIKLDENQAQRALNNSVKVFTVYDDDKPIGMGRVVGDMAVISYIQDLIIIPEYQSRTYNRLCQRNYSGRHKNDALSDVCQGQRDIL